MNARPRILFVIENDHYPRDMRVYNECTALSRHFGCHVLAPRARGEKWRECLESVECYRYPAFEATALASLLLEYALSCLCMMLIVPWIALSRRISVIHVGNPPDFIIPALGWLKLFGVRFVYDVHDISTETLKGKMRGERDALAALLPMLETLESWSLRIADLAIATNESILSRIRNKAATKHACIVRNSNAIRHATLQGILKPPRDGTMRVGYFGVIADDVAAGLENIVTLASTLRRAQVPFEFVIVGSGPGLPRLKRQVTAAALDAEFAFLGFVGLPRAYTLIERFDFGIVSWGDLPKNHLHTAMKVMDYMCCGVPVCSMALHEQIRSTGGIGIHAPSFEEIALRMVHVHRDVEAYEQLRRRTLRHFNDSLCWELQERQLLAAYRTLLHPPC